MNVKFILSKPILQLLYGLNKQIKIYSEIKKKKLNLLTHSFNSWIEFKMK